LNEPLFSMYSYTDLGLLFFVFTGEKTTRRMLVMFPFMLSVAACIVQNMSGDVLSGTAFTLFTKVSVPTGKSQIVFD
jgi:hypothetical protein